MFHFIQCFFLYDLYVHSYDDDEKERYKVHFDGIEFIVFKSPKNLTQTIEFHHSFSFLSFFVSIQFLCVYASKSCFGIHQHGKFRFCLSDNQMNERIKNSRILLFPFSRITKTCTHTHNSSRQPSSSSKFSDNFFIAGFLFHFFRSKKESNFFSPPFFTSYYSIPVFFQILRISFEYHRHHDHVFFSFFLLAHYTFSYLI